MNKKKIKKGLVLIMALMLLLSTAVASYGAVAEPTVSVDKALSETGAYIVKNVANPVIGTIGGEWAVIGLARSGYAVPEDYFESYYKNVVDTLKSANGVLHERKYTEYSRVILGLTAIGKDVTNVGGYNLLEKLADFERVSWQGINGSIWALIALDSHDYEIPQISGVTAQATREMYINDILSKEITAADGTRGGFALAGNVPDADITGMVLIAFSNYQDNPEVKAATERALAAVSSIGGTTSEGEETVESLTQIIIGLSALNIDQKTDNRFIKGDSWTVSEIMKYYVAGGGFEHVLGAGINQMGSEQGYEALLAYDRYLEKKTPLYDMSDVTITKETPASTPAEGNKVMLNGKYMTFTQAPINENGRILAPMRAIFEAFGATIEWDNTAKTVTGALDGKVIKLTIGESAAYVNGEKKDLDVPGKIVNSTTLVPVRFISETLDATVNWDNKTKTVIIEK